MKKKMRFDIVEFQVLYIVKIGLYYLDKEIGHRALLLMEEGILKSNPEKNWARSGWRFTPEGELYYKEFMKKLRENHGHIWKTNRDSDPELYEEKEDEYADQIDKFAYSVGYHNGMICKKCGYSLCEHCTNEFDVPVCTSKGV